MRRPFPWFHAAVAAGFLLGALLLLEAIVMYRYVSGHLLPDHVGRLAGLHVSWLESQARQRSLTTRDELRTLLDEIRAQHPDGIAWIRIANQQAVTLAQSGAPDPGIPPQTVRALIEALAPNVVVASGDLLIVGLPFRYRLDEQGEPPLAPGRPRFNLAEVALPLHSADVALWSLRRNLALSLAAAVALLASMTVFALRFPAYLRAKEFEQQLAVARAVQTQLLPTGCPTCQGLDFSAACLPAWEVGGDYYDVFRTRHGSTAVVLGDVCGKGLPAALLMGLLHGAVRLSSDSSDPCDLAAGTRALNELLCVRTSRERFASLFWADYDPASRLLRYVNAGHLPPLVVRGSQAFRLETGGLVLGIIPGAAYDQGEMQLQPDDVLVVYSDGVTEPANPAGEEFGEDRLLTLLQTQHHRPVSDLQREIVRAVTTFAGPQPLPDDLTVLVTRIT